MDTSFSTMYIWNKGNPIPKEGIVFLLGGKVTVSSEEFMPYKIEGLCNPHGLISELNYNPCPVFTYDFAILDSLECNHFFTNSLESSLKKLNLDLPSQELYFISRKKKLQTKSDVEKLIQMCRSIGACYHASGILLTKNASFENDFLYASKFVRDKSQAINSYLESSTVKR